MADDENYYVQTVGIQVQLPEGGTVLRRFLGIAFCSPEQWEQIKKKPLGEFLSGNKPIVFSDPKKLENAIADASDYDDIVDMIRDEVSREHHERLTESEREMGDDK